MRRTLKVFFQGVRDDRGRLGRLFIVGGSELYVLFFGVEDTVDGGGPQPLGAIEVERGVVPGSGGLFQALTTRPPALILPVQVLVMSLPFVELLNI